MAGSPIDLADDARQSTRGRRTFLATCQALGIPDAERRWRESLGFDLTREQRDRFHEQWRAAMVADMARKPNARFNQRTERKERNAAICDAYRAGDDAVVIGWRFCITPQRVLQILERHGVPRRSISEVVRERHRRARAA